MKKSKILKEALLDAEAVKKSVIANATFLLEQSFLPKGRKSIKPMRESLEDMDTNLPSQVQKFLDRTINIIKGYNLSKKKEQLVIAKVIDALGMDKTQLSQTVQKIKKNDILKK
jgi:hypothetical protein